MNYDLEYSLLVDELEIFRRNISFLLTLKQCRKFANLHTDDGVPFTERRDLLVLLVRVKDIHDLIGKFKLVDEIFIEYNDVSKLLKHTIHFEGQPQTFFQYYFSAGTGLVRIGSFPNY